MSDWPLASSVEQNALVYQAEALPTDAENPAENPICTRAVSELLAEWAEVFLSRPGIIVIKGAFVDRQIDSKRLRF